jgi:1-acyl-sn-glycerol-3-phosphate acyltransferase
MRLGRLRFVRMRVWMWLLLRVGLWWLIVILGTRTRVSGVPSLLAGSHLVYGRLIRLLLLLLSLLLACGRAAEDVDLENVQKAHDGHGERVWEE